MIVYPNKYHRLNPALIQQIILGGSGGGSGFPNPIAWWLINEGTGSTFIDSVAGNNLTSSGNPPSSWESNPGDGLIAPYAVFNTTQSLPMETASGAAFNFSGTTPFSVSNWVLINTPSATQQILGNLEASPSYSGWEILVNDGALQFAIYSNFSSSLGIGLHTPLNAFPTGINTHIAVTYNGNQDVSGVTIYINGVSQTLTTQLNTLSGNAVSSTSPLLMGGRVDGTNLLGVEGAAEQDCRVYDVTLTQAQVTALYTAGPLAGPVPAAIHFWPMNEGSGDTFFDQIGTTNFTATGLTWATNTGMGASAVAQFTPTTPTVANANAYDASLDFNGTQPWTVAFWAYPTQGGAILSNLEVSGGYTGWEIGTGAGNTQWPSIAPGVNAGAATFLLVYNNNGFALSAAQFWALTYDGSNTVAGCKAYLNGSPISLTTFEDTFIPPISSTQPMRIGQRPADGSEIYGGGLAYMRVWNSALPQTSIAALQHAGPK